MNSTFNHIVTAPYWWSQFSDAVVGEKFSPTQHQLWEHRACGPNSHNWNLIANQQHHYIGLATHLIHDPTCV